MGAVTLLGCGIDNQGPGDRSQSRGRRYGPASRAAAVAGIACGNVEVDVNGAAQSVGRLDGASQRDLRLATHGSAGVGRAAALASRVARGVDDDGGAV